MPTNRNRPSFASWLVNCNGRARPKAKSQWSPGLRLCGLVPGGMMDGCVRDKVDMVLPGSIRNEGPIPGVTTDAIEAQKVMREKLADVTHALLLATIQHSLAVATMLAPTVKTVCVDIDPSAVERAVEHQPLQSI